MIALRPRARPAAFRSTAAVAALAALLGLAATAGASPPADRPVRLADVTPSWDRATCFAYSAAARGYACLDVASGADSGDPGLRDFETWTAPPGTAWEGHKAVVLLGGRPDVLPIAEKPYDAGRRIVRVRPARAAIAAALHLGYRRRVTAVRRLAPGSWQRFDGVWLRFATRTHVGDASDQVHGALRLACTRPTHGEAGQLVVENHGERATAFAARGADTIAIGFVETSGGEGAGYSNTAYVLVDVAQRCPAPRRPAPRR